MPNTGAAPPSRGQRGQRTLSIAFDALVATRWRYALRAGAYAAHFADEPPGPSDAHDAWYERLRELAHAMEEAHRSSESARERLIQAVDGFVTLFPEDTPPPGYRRWVASTRGRPRKVASP